MRLVCAPSPTDTIYCGIAVGSGTRHELESESGIAHFTEHLTFKGTQRRSSRQIITHIESVGGDLNAFTGKEETVYYCACHRQHLSRALDLLFDIVYRSTYPQSEIDKEVEVVIDEIESYNDSPSELIYDDFEAQLFHGHPLGRNILGDEQRLRQYTHDDILAYAQRQYRPERSVLFVYGNVSESQILRHIPTISMPHDATPHPTIPPANTIASGTYTYDKGTHQSHVMIGARSFGGNDPRHLALYLANNILGGPGLSSRLSLALREKSALVYTVESTLTTYTDTGVWAVYYGCDHHDVKRCQRLVERELHRLIDSPLSPRTLDAAKRQLTGQIALSYDNPESVAIGMGKRMLHYNRTLSLQTLIDRINDITPEQVLEAARQVFNPERLTILHYT